MKLDLYGWFPKENEIVLRNLIKDNNIKTVIEIGCFLGKSTSFFVEQGCKVIAIDTFEGASDLNDCKAVKKRLPTLFEQFKFNMRELGIEDKVEVYKMRSERAFYEFWEDCVDEVDMVYIDGSHDYEDVWFDINNWQEMAKKVICGDDYTKHHDGVRKAVDDLLPDANKLNRVWYKIIK